MCFNGTGIWGGETIWRMCQCPPQQLSVFWAYVIKRIVGCLYYGVCVTHIKNTVFDYNGWSI